MTLRAYRYAEEPDHCRPGALIGRLGLLLQALLVGVAFGSLVLKRCLEPPSQRRSWLVWLYDTSKQAIGASVTHLMNVLLASWFPGDPCTWYVVSYLLDSTVGLFFVYCSVRLTLCLARCNRWNSLRFGHYGAPPSGAVWRRQCLVFVALTVAAKLLVAVMVQWPFWRAVRRWILSPIRSETTELLVVLLVVPLVVNSFIFWVTDNFTKRRHDSAARCQGILGGDSPKKPLTDDEAMARERLLSATNDSDSLVLRKNPSDVENERC